MECGGGASTSDRIISGTDVVTVNGNSDTVSFTLGGATVAYLHPTMGFVGPGISATTNRSSFTTVYASGNVGIGTTAPVATLNVSGSIVTTAFNAGSGTSIDWSQSNAQYTSATCGAFTFSNMQDGGVYTLAVQNTTANTCVFSHTGLTFRGVSGYGTTTAGGHTVFVFQRLGTVVYVTQVRGLV